MQLVRYRYLFVPDWRRLQDLAVRRDVASQVQVPVCSRLALSPGS